MDELCAAPRWQSTCPCHPKKLQSGKCQSCKFNSLYSVLFNANKTNGAGQEIGVWPLQIFMRHGGGRDVISHLYCLLLVQFRAWLLHITQNVCHSSLVSHESCQMGRLAGVIPGEWLDLSLAPPAPLLGQETQRTTSWICAKTSLLRYITITTSGIPYNLNPVTKFLFTCRHILQAVSGHSPSSNYCPTSLARQSCRDKFWVFLLWCYGVTTVLLYIWTLIGPEYWDQNPHFSALPEKDSHQTIKDWIWCSCWSWWGKVATATIVHATVVSCTTIKSEPLLRSRLMFW